MKLILIWVCVYIGSPVEQNLTNQEDDNLRFGSRPTLSFGSWYPPWRA